MRTELTQTAARKRLHRYFVGTLRALPANLTLALVHPEIPQARFHNGVTLPCDDSDEDVRAEFFDIAYWIIGTTPDNVDGIFESVIRFWIELGWPIQTDHGPRPRAAYARTSDNFSLSLQQSIDGYVSLAGSTPPFSPGPAEESPLPERIEHPLAATQPVDDRIAPE
ncbi:hypothetical protein [Nocardia stercoris]|uniref:hypothetical protein n=1 Tax=Nocardia stercoris TaxID=2483361 RepID=UPI0011C3AD84|nr:hypothetical protein [Nocardia stercoris]